MRKLFLFLIIGLAFLSCEESPTASDNTGVNANPGSQESIKFYTIPGTGAYYYGPNGSKIHATSTSEGVKINGGSYVFMGEAIENAEYLEMTLKPSDATNHYKAKFTYNNGTVVKDIDGVIRIEIGDVPQDEVVGLLELGTTTDVSGAEWTGSYDYYEVLNGGYPDPNKD